MLQEFKNNFSIVLFINIIQKIFSYGIFFILAIILPHETYGLFETIFSIGSFGILVFGFQAESAFARYYYIERERKNIPSAILNIILIYLIGATLFFVILPFFISSFNIENLAIYLTIFLFSNLIYGLILIRLRYELNFEKFLLYAIADIVFFLSLLLFFFTQSLLSQQTLILLFSLPKIILILFQFVRFSDFKSLSISLERILKYLKYSINIVPVVLINFGIILYSRLLVLNNFDSIQLSNFSMALRISMGYLFLNEVFRFLVDPILIKKEKDNIEESLVVVFNSYSKILFYFNCLMILIFLFLDSFFLQIKFQNLSFLVPILFLSNFLNVLINFFVLINNLSFKTFYNFVSYLCGLFFFISTIYFFHNNILNYLVSILIFNITTLISIFFLAKKSYNLGYSFKYFFASLFILISFIYLNCV